MRKPTPIPILRRLPQYLHILSVLKEKDLKVVTSKTIADTLGIDQTQVRKDIVITGISGTPKKGFLIDELITAIREHLNWHKPSNAFLVGTGSLGTALLGYEGFKEYGLNFIAAFDIDPKKVGKEISGMKVMHLDKLASKASELNVEICVLTVPASAAQQVTNEIVKSGIKGIWNFVPKQLIVPASVVVENAQFTQSLAILTRKLTEKALGSTAKK